MIKMKHRTDFEEELLTKENWNKKNLTPKEGEEGLKLWTNPHHNRICIYYSMSQLRPMTEDEIAAYKQNQREKAQKKYQKRKQREERRLQEEIQLQERITKSRIDSAVEAKGRELGTELIKLSNRLPLVKCNNKTGGIVFDTETTGLSEFYDEILQISIIDLDGNTLLNTYVKPYWNTHWGDAQRIHGITPEMVKDAPYPHELIPVVKGIFESANQLIAYNTSVDLGMLRQWGVEPAATQKQTDVMVDFAEVYGEWIEYYQDYKWQNLTTAAFYYDYEFEAHDSLEDVKATLHVYNRMKEEKKQQEKMEVVEEQKMKLPPQKPVKIRRKI